MRGIRRTVASPRNSDLHLIGMSSGQKAKEGESVDDSLKLSLPQAVGTRQSDNKRISAHLSSCAQRHVPFCESARLVVILQVRFLKVDSSIVLGR